LSLNSDPAVAFYIFLALVVLGEAILLYWDLIGFGPLERCWRSLSTARFWIKSRNQTTKSASLAYKLLGHFSFYDLCYPSKNLTPRYDQTKKSILYYSGSLIHVSMIAIYMACRERFAYLTKMSGVPSTIGWEGYGFVFSCWDGVASRYMSIILSGSIVSN